MEEFSNKTNELVKEKLDLFMDLIADYSKPGCKINKTRIDFIEESLPILRNMDEIFKQDILYHRLEDKRKSYKQDIIALFPTDLDRACVSINGLVSYIRYGRNVTHKYVPMMLMISVILEFYDKNKKQIHTKELDKTNK